MARLTWVPKFGWELLTRVNKQYTIAEMIHVHWTDHMQGVEPGMDSFQSVMVQNYADKMVKIATPIIQTLPVRPPPGHHNIIIPSMVHQLMNWVSYKDK